MERKGEIFLNRYLDETFLRRTIKWKQGKGISKGKEGWGGLPYWEERCGGWGWGQDPRVGKVVLEVIEYYKRRLYNIVPEQVHIFDKELGKFSLTCNTSFFFFGLFLFFFGIGTYNTLTQYSKTLHGQTHTRHVFPKTPSPPPSLRPDTSHPSPHPARVVWLWPSTRLG